MSTRTNAQEEKAAALRSVMNVISMLDHGTPRRSNMGREFDLRPLLPNPEAAASGEDDRWEQFVIVVSQDAMPSKVGDNGER